MNKPNDVSIAKKIYLYLPIVFFVCQLIIGLYATFWLLYNHQPETGDDVEHLHSTWLVYQGKVPYIDFFQHHNPLLWYLFAPLMSIFAYSLEVFDAVRIISTFGLFLTLTISALIVKKFFKGGWLGALLTIASVFPSYVIYSGSDFRPDNYMVLSFMAGVYWSFSYLESKKQRDLILSFFAMFLSFMFMQKIIFILAFWGLSIIYLLYKKIIPLQDFLKAIILPLIGVVIFLSWLAYHGMIERYWLTNYIFNLYIPDVYNTQVEKTKLEFYVLSAIAFASACYYLYKGNIPTRIFCLLWLAEASQRFFYFSLDRHYYYLLDVFNAVMVGAIANVLITKWRWFAYIFVALSVAGGLAFKNFAVAKKLQPNYHRYVTPKYVLEQTNRCDSVLNGYGLTYGIFTKDITYYWNLNGQLDVIGNKIGLAPLPDLNAAVQQHLPKIIYTGTYWDEKSHQQHINKPVHMISNYLRDKYYQQSLFVDIFILKPEYEQMRRCRYDVSTGTWNYHYKE